MENKKEKLKHQSFHGRRNKEIKNEDKKERLKIVSSTETGNEFLAKEKNHKRKPKEQVLLEYDDQNEQNSELRTKKRSTNSKSENLRKRETITQQYYREPNNWKEAYEKIKEMRKQKEAPVDTMGCASYQDPNADPKEIRYDILTSLMLSSQTKDPITYSAMNNLREYGLNVEKILVTDEEKIDSLISKVGFHKRKASYIKKTAEILEKKYNSDIPNNFNDLISLPGVGPKMAHLCLQHAWGIVDGIGVDVHVNRITRRLGWVKGMKNTPEEARKELESWMPREYWKELNGVFVGFGQTICTPVNPSCSSCLVRFVCPSSKVKETSDLNSIIGQS